MAGAFVDVWLGGTAPERWFEGTAPVFAAAGVYVGDVWCFALLCWPASGGHNAVGQWYCGALLLLSGPSGGLVAWLCCAAGLRLAVQGLQSVAVLLSLARSAPVAAWSWVGNVESSSLCGMVALPGCAAGLSCRCYLSAESGAEFSTAAAQQPLETLPRMLLGVLGCGICVLFKFPAGPVGCSGHAMEPSASVCVCVRVLVCGEDWAASGLLLGMAEGSCLQECAGQNAAAIKSQEGHAFACS